MKESIAVTSKEIHAIKVKQWLSEWVKVRTDERAFRSPPPHHFYLFTISASALKALTGIYRRERTEGLPPSQDTGIQRRHDETRSKEIREFVKYGYPWSELSEAKRKSGKYDNLRKPGWLPTSIIVNILKPDDKRRGKLKVHEDDIIQVVESDQQTAIISLPDGFTGFGWEPKKLRPIEVIDGQHRLWAFEEGMDEDFELPVVAFHGLDISWQAYLFWTINIKPKKINASLAFDLYPLLRTEDWLEKFSGPSIYRETRAQELTEVLWSYPDCPWYRRINMLGEPGLKQRMVTQAAWIRSLLATYVKAWEGPGVRVGGLFGAPVGEDEGILPWSRSQQAAFLILMGQKILSAVLQCKEKWAESLRKEEGQRGIFERELDPAFYSPDALFSTDIGIRGLLYVTNDLCFLNAGELELENWIKDEETETITEKALGEVLNSLKNQKVAKFLEDIANRLVSYDWRTSNAPGLSEMERTLKKVFRGGSGYGELRIQLLKHISDEKGVLGEVAKKALLILE